MRINRRLVKTFGALALAAALQAPGALGASDLEVNDLTVSGNDIQFAGGGWGASSKPMIDLNQGGSRIYDDMHLRIETDDNLYLSAGTAVYSSMLLPHTNAMYDLGESQTKWKDAYLSGTVNTYGLIVSGPFSLGGGFVTASAAEINILDGATLSTAELNILDGVTATAVELNVLDGITSTVAELNILDGVTATAAELNVLDGITSTVAELNILDGVTATAAELNVLDGITSTVAELNILDGVTSTAAELNILDGVTATAAELNILDGVTATATELNYVDGVTSAIQTQLDAKADIAGAENISGVWEVQDNIDFAFGNDGDIVFLYDETTDDRLEIVDAADNVLMTIADAGTTGNVTISGDLTVTGTVSGTVEATGTTNTSFTLDSDSTGVVDQDLFLYFEDDGVATAHYLGWDDGLSTFVLNDDLIPSAADTYNLGSADAEWQALYIGDDATIYMGVDQDVAMRWDNTAAALEIEGGLVAIGQDPGATTATGDGDLFVEDALEVDGATDLDGALDVAGATTLNGTVGLGNATGDTITATGYFGSALIPSADDTHDLGLVGNEWQDLYIDGVAYIDGIGEDLLPSSDDAFDLGTAAIQWQDIFIDGLAYVDGFGEHLLASSADALDLGSTTTEWRSLYLGDNATGVAFGQDQDVTFRWDNTAASLEIEGGLVSIGQDPGATTATGDGDLFVEDALEVDGATDLDGALDVDGTANLDAVDIDLAAGEEVNIDATTTAHTGTGGVLDIDVGAGNAAVDGINLALTVNDGATAGTNFQGMVMTLTANDADADVFGLAINAADAVNAGAGSYEAAITIDNADTTAGSMPDAIIITSSGVDAGITDAIDVSAANITNALNVGANTITGAAAVIDFTEFDVAATGAITVGDGEGLDTNAAGALDLGITNATSILVGTNLLTDAAGTNALGSTAAEWANLFLTDGDATLQFGAAQNVTMGYDAVTAALEVLGGLVSIGADPGGATATGAGDLLVTDALEVDGATDLDGALDVDGTANLDAVDIDLAATEEVNIDATTTAHTGTGGVVDIDVGAGNAAVDGINLALTVNDGATAGTNFQGLAMTLTANDADADLFGIVISAAATANAAAGSYEAAISIDNADDAAGSMPDAILIASSGVAAGITDAIDASADNITNALNVGANTITGAAAVINFTEFDVAATGAITVGDGEGLDTNAAGALDLGITNATSILVGTNLLTDAAGTNALGSTAAEWANLYLTDGDNTLQFGADQDVTMGFDGTSVALEVLGGLVSIGADPGGATATGAGDLLVTDALEVDGATDLDGALDVDGTANLDATAVVLGAAEELDIDATTTAHTGTAGVIDLNVSAGNAAVDAIDIALTQNDGAGAGVNAIAQDITLTGNDADGDVFGIVITAADAVNAGAGTYEAAISIDNADTTAGSMPDAIIIASSGVAAGVTDAIDASATNITNAINVGANTITGGAAVIDFTSFDVLGTGATTILNTLTTGVDGTGHTVTFYSDTAGDSMVWSDTGASLTITGTNAANALVVADGNADFGAADDVVFAAGAISATDIADPVRVIQVPLTAWRVDANPHTDITGATTPNVSAEGNFDTIEWGNAETTQKVTFSFVMPDDYASATEFHALEAHDAAAATVDDTLGLDWYNAKNGEADNPTVVDEGVTAFTEAETLTEVTIAMDGGTLEANDAVRLVFGWEAIDQTAHIVATWIEYTATM